MEGDKVTEALLDETSAAYARATELREQWGALAPAAELASSLGSYFSSDGMLTPTFYANMLEFGVASKARAGTLVRLFWEKEAKGIPWPDPNGTTVNSHAEVSRYLSEYGARAGTSAADAEVSRFNSLGFMPLNGAMSPELGNRTALNLPVEVHAWVRPLLTKICGPGSTRWSKTMVRESCDQFFEGRTSIPTGSLSIFNTRLLHKIFFNMDLSEKEGEEFMALQFKLLIINGLPESAVANSAVRSVVGVDECLVKKRECEG